MATMSCKTGTLTEYPAYSAMPQERKTEICGAKTVPSEASVQTATSTTVDFPVSALRMIHRHSVMLNRKEMKPTTALMMPL